MINPKAAVGNGSRLFYCLKAANSGLFYHKRQVIFPTTVKPLISNKNVQNRPESEQFREMLGVFYFQKQIRKPGAGKEVMQMPRMPKYLKREWAFFLGDCGRKKYNPLCRKCERSCKQSFRAVVILCTQYKSKRSIKQ